MSNEGESSQTSKFEDEEEKIQIDPKPTKPHNGKKIDQFLLSPNSKYAVTLSNDDRSMCGWQLDKDQPVEQIEDELIDLKEMYPESKYLTLHAVSDNKSVVIEASWKITVFNLTAKKKVDLELSREVFDKILDCKFYDSEDFILNRYIKREDSNLILKFSFKNSHKQSWIINNSIFCGKRKDVIDEIFCELEFISSDEAERLLLFYNDKFDARDPYNVQHDFNDKPTSNLYTELLSKKALTKLDISNAQIKELINEKIYCLSDKCLWIQEVSKERWIKYLQENLQDTDKIRILPSKSQIKEILQRLKNKNEDNESISMMEETKLYEGSTVKWEVNGKEKIIRAQKFSLNT
ncbi:16752_t:CDS:2 [Racocetra fulgida]|uniref:16752_t:CDS:1 n=1 Tax=Racocetra fulgida TaxID=60492 RepID=A0A9N9A3E5_9GLOM|nr:16752_t:CDS:2 [Racocetra fulgida]